MAAWVWPWVSRLYVKGKSLEQLRLGEHATGPQRRLFAEIERQMDDGQPVRAIVLKARQMGLSTAVQAVGNQAAFCLPGMSGMVIAHENEASEHLLGINRNYWERSWLSRPWETRHMAGRRLGWDNGSKLSIATAGNLDTGRSQTLQFLHASEAAFWSDPEELMTGLAQVMPRLPFTFQFLESTANGVGNWFHRTWLAAKDGEVSYAPCFYPWWEHDEYVASRVGVDASGFVATDDDERFYERYLASQGLDAGEIAERLVWRREILRTECHGDVDKFRQEYPAHDDEAFVATGRNVFVLAALKRIFEPRQFERGRLEPRAGSVEFVPDRDGPLHVFVRPSSRRDWGQYMVGADPTKQMDGDFAVMQVLNRRSWEQCAVWRSKTVDNLEYARQLMLLGRWYNDAVVAPEAQANGGGIALLVRQDYPNLYVHEKTNSVRGQLASTYGFVMNRQGKHEAIQNLQAAVNESASDAALAKGAGLLLHDQQTFAELRDYVRLDNGEFGNGSGSKHDDHVTSLAIALTATITEAAALVGRSAGQPVWQSSSRIPDAPLSDDRSRAREVMEGFGAREAPALVRPAGGWGSRGDAPGMFDESDWEGW